MKIILLSGGSGKRLWPLSNDARSKQFLRMLPAPDGSGESMIQRTVRQLRAADINAEILVATGAIQRDAIENQLGKNQAVVTEPQRRHTFPAIALACMYLADKGVTENEPIVVMPCDTFADDSYFAAVADMAQCVSHNRADLLLMGVNPVYPSAKYGYILPEPDSARDGALTVSKFVEKPEVDVAEQLIADGAMWNGGVFAFRLGFVTGLVHEMLPDANYQTLLANYADLPHISFDFQVVERTRNAAVVPYNGPWKDLGTWNTLTDELRTPMHGNVTAEGCTDTYVINELDIPMVCLGLDSIVVAASPDGILVTDRRQSENIKHIVLEKPARPMYEERRWGEYKVIDSITFDDGFSALTKQLTLRPGSSISYQRHTHRDEIWTFVNGSGEIVIDGERRPVTRGDVVNIRRGQMHTLRATTSLTFIEVQQGSSLVEDDIERFPYQW